MNENVLPTDAEELGELVSSGHMTIGQIDEFIEKHAHYVHDCDVCSEIGELFEDYPLQLLLEHNVSRMTHLQCELVHERLEDHIVPEDQGTRANIASEKLRLSVGRGLLGYVEEDLKLWLDEEFLEKSFGAEEILVSVQGYLQDLTKHEGCNKNLLERLVAIYHNPGEWREGGLNCTGDVSACTSCQDMLKSAELKLG